MKDHKFYLVIITIAVTGLAWASRATAAETGPVNAGFEEGEPGQPPPHWYVPKIDGYHVRLSKEKTNSGEQCLAIQRGEGTAGPFGNVMQQVDAAPYRGQRVRFRAAVRTQSENEQGTAHLWLRVDLPKKRVGFFDNMFNRPIDNKDWDHYEIFGDVADNADVINIGMF